MIGAVAAVGAGVVVGVVLAGVITWAVLGGPLGHDGPEFPY